MCAPWLEAFYSRSAKVAFRFDKENFDNIFVKNSQGVFQGCVWGAITACCLLLNFQRKLDGHLGPNAEKVDIACADDWAIIGKPETVIDCWRFLMINAPPKNSSISSPEPWALKVNIPKTALYSVASRAEMAS